MVATSLSLIDFLTQSTSPFHAADAVATALNDAGFTRLELDDVGAAASLKLGARVYWVQRDASVIAAVLGSERMLDGGLRIVGAHTDSPGLRLVPHSESRAETLRMLNVEVYGGLPHWVWLDRDLSIAGRVVVEVDGKLQRHLIDVRRPVARIPSVAIHLDRDINEKGLRLQVAEHLRPIFGLDDGTTGALGALLVDELKRAGCTARAEDIRGFELGLYDTQPPSMLGLSGEFISSARLDNLAMCFAAVRALTEANRPRTHTQLIALYNHEECGSRSDAGAGGPFADQVLALLAAASGSAHASLSPSTLAKSFMISADMAHAVHPNYADRHPRTERPMLGRGPVIKLNANQSYATDAMGWATVEQLCRNADIVPQTMTAHPDLRCGTTIGPIQSTKLGIAAVDMGAPMLSMHSSRELACGRDIDAMATFLKVFLETETLP